MDTIIFNILILLFLMINEFLQLFSFFFNLKEKKDYLTGSIFVYMDVHTRHYPKIRVNYKLKDLFVIF